MWRVVVSNLVVAHLLLTQFNIAKIKMKRKGDEFDASDDEESIPDIFKDPRLTSSSHLQMSGQL